MFEKERIENNTAKNIPFIPLRLAAHLCGSRCQEVLDGDYLFIAEIQKFGFKRVQINATKANNVHFNLKDIELIISNIRNCMKKHPILEFILQYNVETNVICDNFLESSEANMSILYDSSCGLGVQLSEFNMPKNTSILHGYAGGINGKNISDILRKIERVNDGRDVWIDMESSLRSRVLDNNDVARDVFSVEKCFDCITVGVQEFGLRSV